MTQSNYPREFSIFTHTHTHTQLIEFWPTDIFEECERVGFHPSKTFVMSFIIPWRVNIMRFHPKSFFFCQFIISIHIYLLLSIFFFKNRNGDHFQIQLSLDTFETFSSGHGDACIYAHIAYYIVPLWFWLIVWGEFLMRVLDWNVKTINQWQIAWTKLWKLLELTFAGTLVGELVELPWAELMWI